MAALVRPTPRSPLLRYASDGLVLLDRHGEALEVAPCYPRVLGYSPAELYGMRTLDLIHPEDRPSWEQAWSSVTRLPGNTASVPVRARHANGRWRLVEVTLVNALDDPAAEGVVATIHDPGAPEPWEGTHPASASEVIGDRNTVLALLGEALECLAGGAQALVVVAKLDQLQLVERAYGNEAATRLLLAAASRLRSVLRPHDRLGQVHHDRLAVICQTRGGRRAATSLAGRLSACLSEPFDLGGDHVVLTASQGMAVSSRPGANPEALLGDADLAAEVASAGGGNRWSFFDPAECADALSRVTLPGLLHEALNDGEFLLHYQPIVSLATRDIVGAEALVRWAPPGGALTGPEAFITIAESSGLIMPLGTWVIQEACRTAARWPSKGRSVAVNLSARQIEDPGLPGIVEKTLEEAGLEPTRLTLEVTEGVLVAGTRPARRRLETLRRMGVKVAVDDFGTGYSSLAYLKDLPVDALKVDRCFVARLGTSHADAVIVGAVIHLARDLGLEVIAEGVETVRQCDELRQLGCPYAQGYLFGRPSSAYPLGCPVVSEPEACLSPPRPRDEEAPHG